MNIKKTVVTVIAVTLPLFIGLSRNYLGVHFPTDVLCGWIIGTITMLLFYFLERKFGYKVCFIIQIAIGAIGLLYCRDNEFFSAYGVLIGLFFAFLYEEKFVNFETSRKWRSYILRPLFGIIVFIIISTLLKLPLSFISVDEYSAFQFGYRCFRYAVSTFVMVGLYPYLFKRIRFL